MGTRTILLLEDDRTLAVDIQLALADRGFCVRAVASLGDALASLRALPPPDAVVTELALFDGPPATRLLEELAREPALASVPVVVISGWPRARDVAAAHGIPAENVLAKPLDLRALEAAVARSVAEVGERPLPARPLPAADLPHRTGIAS